MKEAIKEIIVVEGKDDVAAVLRAVDATVLITNGMGLEGKRLRDIENASKHADLIVLTDPDVPGTLIRNRVSEVVPTAKHAFISRRDARHPVTGKLGVEYAKPEVILEALHKAYATEATNNARYTMTDLMKWGLTGGAGAKEKRTAFCDLMHIGSANAKTLLKRLNAFAPEEAIILEALQQLEDNHESE